MLQPESTQTPVLQKPIAASQTLCTAGRLCPQVPQANYLVDHALWWRLHILPPELCIFHLLLHLMALAVGLTPAGKPGNVVHEDAV